jgi:hypothetical protein
MSYCWRTRKRRDFPTPITSLKAPRLWSNLCRKLGFVGLGVAKVNFLAK